jgi:hypothetical protein
MKRYVGTLILLAAIAPGLASIPSARAGAYKPAPDFTASAFYPAVTCQCRFDHQDELRWWMCVGWSLRCLIRF